MTISIASDLLFGVVATAIGAIGVGAGLRELGRAADSDEWPSVEGEIEETGVLTEPGERGGTLYRPEVRYHYRVADVQYVSNRISFGGVVSMSLRSWAQGVVARYRKQKSVRVHVCPTDPDLSVLEPGVHWTSWLVPIVFAIFLGLGLRYLLTYFGLLGL